MCSIDSLLVNNFLPEVIIFAVLCGTKFINNERFTNYGNEHVTHSYNPKQVAS